MKAHPTPTASKRKIDDYFKSKERDTLDNVLARMTAVDGLPFSIFVTSKDMRALLKAKGYADLPISSKTVRNRVVKYSKEVRSQITSEITLFKKEGQRFSLTFYEWSSSSNKRFMNINVHISKEFWNLGMVRIKESMTAEVCVQLLEGHLKQHGISLNKDIVAIVTDGPNVMLKVGRIVKTEHQLCIAHGIHLAVCDVLYQNKNKQDKPIEREDEVVFQEESEELPNDDDEFDEENILDLADTGLVSASSEDLQVGDVGELSDSEIYNISDVVKKIRLF